ncbi:Protein GDAP2-like protein [Leptotrombidium deliense]|uniref:Protein GDAP2-like protein n=1 Tax=Leptotrombidium deliense TaxID=299467 RepID=A0A443SQR3_9ACAR|nr:Protein GDAP2-like protein [Leptotrombidium deliense]
MDDKPLDASTSRAEIIDFTSLKTWQQISAREIDLQLLTSEKSVHEEPPFPLDSNLNKKVALWVGDITTLNCEAIVNTTNENFSDRDSLCQRILYKGGPQLRHHIRNSVRSCRTGDAKITKGYNLPSRYVIHTVGPKYNQKYHTAAESALFSCYSKVFQSMREQKIKSLGLCPITSTRRGYPPLEGAHMALRCVRRFLENHGDDVEVIIFVVEGSDIGVYEVIMPYYFPRSSHEEEASKYLLPKDIGGKDGEPVLPERQIRIADNPVTAHMHSEVEASVDLCSGLDSSVIVGKSSFAKMHGDVDKRWRSSRPSSSQISANDPVSSELQRRTHYERLLRRAKMEDLSEIAALRCLYVTGEDRFGRPVIVFIGKRFVTSKVDLEKALLYLIVTLDRIVKEEYSVIYFHTLTDNSNHPSLHYIRYVFDTLEYKYKKNLRAFYVIHPTFWNRVVTWWFTTFTAPSLKNKVYCLGGVEYLSSLIPLEQLQVPSFIMDYDFKVNGVRYSSAQVETGEAL